MTASATGTYGVGDTLVKSDQSSNVQTMPQTQNEKALSFANNVEYGSCTSNEYGLCGGFSHNNNYKPASTGEGYDDPNGLFTDATLTINTHENSGEGDCGLGEGYPDHWSEPPFAETMDLRTLPDGSQGSSTKYAWMEENLKADYDNGIEYCDVDYSGFDWYVPENELVEYGSDGSSPMNNHTPKPENLGLHILV